MKNWMMMMLICACCVCGALSTNAAEEMNKKPLDEVFDHMVIFPYDYQDKAFVNGQKTDVYGDYEMVQRDERVLVPIRLMSYLADQVNRNYGEWSTIWQAEKPDDVLLYNMQLHKTIKFTVNSKTMLINNKPHTMDVAPQKVNGRIVLPLRSAAEALDKKIEWLDGLILISDEYVDLQQPKTLAIKDKIKTELGDTRKPVGYEKAVIPITKFGDAVYYIKQIHNQNSITEKLYRRVDGQNEVQLSFPGTPVFGYHKIINQELYYVTMINNQWELDVFSFADNKTRKISTLEEWWTPRDGWIEDIQYIDNEFYINVHSGDLTMGSETLYKVEQGTLKRVADSKSFISYIKTGDYIYSMAFNYMYDMPNNLNRVNVKTGEVTAIGNPAYAYGINRTIEEHGGISYTSKRAMYIKNDYLYTLGYKESDPKDESAVYRISLTDQTQVKLTSSAREMWMVDNKIYYIDSKSGYFASVDHDGNNKRTLIERKVRDVQFFNGSIYYTANAKGNVSELGVLYRYEIAKDREVKLSDKLIHSFYVGNAGMYYLSHGYDLGLYKIDASGHNVRLVKDNINTAILTDAGMVYTLTYKEGIYSVK
jgi:hypothetical protein